MNFVKGWILLLALCAAPSSAVPLDGGAVVMVILTQDNSYHSGLAHDLRADVEWQATQLDIQKAPVIRIVPEEIPHQGSWTVIPILPRLSALDGNNSSWVFFCEERTEVNLKNLLSGLSQYDHTKETWVGYALYDAEPSIIHHFAFAEDPTQFKYPLFPAGFAITTTMLNRLAKRSSKEVPEPSEFSIDASHELALTAGVPLQHAPHVFCVKDSSHTCASFPRTDFSCGAPLPANSLFFAVKTWHQFHDSRVPIVQSTWGLKAKHLEFFSDVHNSTIPTTKVGVGNTERGHCSKTMSILKLSLERTKNLTQIAWVILADDDTIISVTRLQSLLACFSNNSVVGERYGYNVKHKLGYNYITGGGGIAFGVATLSRIVAACRCPSDDSPDDMLLGLCLTRTAAIPLIHSPLFHQARPADYAGDYLQAQKPVSFHKHWMVDPVSVYNQWFSQLDYELVHTEL